MGDNARVLRTGSTLSDQFRTLSGPTMYDSAGEPAGQRRTPGPTRPGPASGSSARSTTRTPRPPAPWATTTSPAAPRTTGSSASSATTSIQGDGSILGQVRRRGAGVGEPRRRSATCRRPVVRDGPRRRRLRRGGRRQRRGVRQPRPGRRRRRQLRPVRPADRPSQRPDGDDILFGGAGLRTARNALGPGGDSTCGSSPTTAATPTPSSATTGRLVPAGVRRPAGSSRSPTTRRPTSATTRPTPSAPQPAGGPSSSFRGRSCSSTTRPGSPDAAGIGGSDLVKGEDGDDVIHGHARQRRPLRRRVGRRHLRRRPAATRSSAAAARTGSVADDGMIKTSRNGVAEPLYGLAASAGERHDRPARSVHRGGRRSGRVPEEDGGPDRRGRAGGVGLRRRRHRVRRAGRRLHPRRRPGTTPCPGPRPCRTSSTTPGRSPIAPLAYDPGDPGIDGESSWRPSSTRRPSGRCTTGSTRGPRSPGSCSTSTLRRGRPDHPRRQGLDLRRQGQRRPVRRDRARPPLRRAGRRLPPARRRPGHERRGQHRYPYDQSDPANATGGGDFAYGGGGLDILIANSGGDRMFDWTGEFNSFLVPFARFGLPTVNRPRPRTSRRSSGPGGRRRGRPGPDRAERRDRAGHPARSRVGRQPRRPDDPQPGNGHGFHDGEDGPDGGGRRTTAPRTAAPDRPWQHPDRQRNPR